MVLLLTLVAGIMLAVMIERNTAQVAATQRELDAYTFAHATRGLGDALDAWTKFYPRTPIAELLDEDGRAFTITVERGQQVTVHLIDGQGLALANLTGLSQANVRTGREVLRHLREDTGDKAPMFVREDGPLAVSVNTAPLEVLEAVLAAVSGDESGSGLVTDLVARRDAEGLIDPQALQTAIDQSALSPEHKNRAKALLTANPALWRVHARASGADGRGTGVAYRGWAIITRGATVASGDRAAAVQRSVAIFGWERVESNDEADRRN
ncbi:MAG: hypothetical protein HBSAPP03_09750 [Phycisphaerae bacterium]|nr:MAG: hypothetical protein HBSAPP03_09750 [Phycisphaerae bacterium]